MEKPMLDPEGRPYVRTHECGYDHPRITWDDPVVLSDVSKNLSGEGTSYCPICRKASQFASAAFVVLEDGAKKYEVP